MGNRELVGQRKRGLWIEINSKKGKGSRVGLKKKPHQE